MANRNKRRGSKAENKVAKTLSSVIGWRFERTPGSGSGHTWAFFQGQNVRGDVVCRTPDVNFPFLVESKKTTGFPWDLLFTDSPPADFTDWWEKAKSDANKEQLFAALVIARNQGPMVCFTSQTAWQALGMDVQKATARMRYRNKMLMVCTVEAWAIAFKERKNK